MSTDASDRGAEFLASIGLRPPDPALWKYKCSRGCGTPTTRPEMICGDCEVADDRERERRASVRDRLRCLPARYADARFDAACLRARVADARAIEVARTALAQHPVLVLLGPPGAGKSTIAAAVLAVQAEAGRSIAWAPALRLAVARGEGRLGVEPEEIRQAIRADVVCLDDIGQEGLVSTSAVVDVVHARHDAARAIVVTSGLTRRDLGSRYGGGVGRRLLEGATVVEMTCKRST